MCEKCLDAAVRHYQTLTGDELHSLLWGATCFPFGQPEDVERQLIDLKKHTDGSLEQALAYADDELTVDMDLWRYRDDQAELEPVELGLGI